MSLYCDKCGTTHDCTVCPNCQGFGKQAMTYDKHREAFEDFCRSNHWDIRRCGNQYAATPTQHTWEGWQAAMRYRDEKEGKV